MQHTPVQHPSLQIGRFLNINLVVLIYLGGRNYVWENNLVQEGKGSVNCQPAGAEKETWRGLISIPLIIPARVHLWLGGAGWELLPLSEGLCAGLLPGWMGIRGSLAWPEPAGMSGKSLSLSERVSVPSRHGASRFLSRVPLDVHRSSRAIGHLPPEPCLGEVEILLSRGWHLPAPAAWQWGAGTPELHAVEATGVKKVKTATKKRTISY